MPEEWWCLVYIGSVSVSEIVDFATAVEGDLREDYEPWSYRLQGPAAPRQSANLGVHSFHLGEWMHCIACKSSYPGYPGPGPCVVALPRRHFVFCFFEEERGRRRRGVK